MLPLNEAPVNGWLDKLLFGLLYNADSAMIDVYCFALTQAVMQ